LGWLVRACRKVEKGEGFGRGVGGGWKLLAARKSELAGSNGARGVRGEGCVRKAALSLRGLLGWKLVQW